MAYLVHKQLIPTDVNAGDPHWAQSQIWVLKLYGNDDINEFDTLEDAQSGQVDIDEEEAAENLELPGADLSGEELTVRVVPKQLDEFTCSKCFLVHHITQLARGEGAKAVCTDCD